MYVKVILILNNLNVIDEMDFKEIADTVYLEVLIFTCGLNETLPECFVITCYNLYIFVSNLSVANTAYFD